MPRNCDSCGIPLIPVFPEYNKRKTDKPAYQDALKIELKGEFGGFLDDYVEPFIVCNNCANSILHDLPPIFVSRIGPFIGGQALNNILLYEKKDS